MDFEKDHTYDTCGDVNRVGLKASVEELKKNYEFGEHVVQSHYGRLLIAKEKATKK